MSGPVQEWNAFEERVKSRLGISPFDGKRNEVLRGIRGRMERRGVSTVRAYTELALEDEEERAALVETIRVSETWFFRDLGPFLYLRDRAGEWVRRKGRLPRVLVAGCASGEEAWSVAAMLAGAGSLPGEAVVTGFDLSKAALEVARAARYARRCFRGNEDFAGPGFFSWKGEECEVHERYRGMCRFYCANVLELERDERFERSYDAVFFRNVMIYFGRRERALAMAQLSSKLDAEGLFFAGHAEAISHYFPEFEAVGPQDAFAYRRRSPQSVKTTRVGIPEVAGGAETGRGEAFELDHWERLANTGKLRAALEGLREFVGQRPVNVRGHVLLGTVLSALGRELEAARYLRKAVSLSGTDREVLWQLILVLERAGLHADAREMRGKLQRMAETEEDVHA